MSVFGGGGADSVPDLAALIGAADLALATGLFGRTESAGGGDSGDLTETSGPSSSGHQ